MHEVSLRFVLELDGQRHEVRYTSEESDTELFGGNSIWGGQIWLQFNLLIVVAL